MMRGKRARESRDFVRVFVRRACVLFHRLSSILPGIKVPFARRPLLEHPWTRALVGVVPVLLLVSDHRSPASKHLPFDDPPSPSTLRSPVDPDLPAHTPSAFMSSQSRAPRLRCRRPCSRARRGQRAIVLRCWIIGESWEWEGLVASLEER
ncbi:hypothetical protein DFP72DRAFT_501913 [Ephemerocybe angulata]|uniref:Uncharacterized protein n=1 Tax=Ephemerocybe angulata TaxID=980116 RepID=A0A8H6M494_9AGAR|nr:hypothetical protein DFP72DRAFT_501913 [Tulosesus angulatus]